MDTLEELIKGMGRTLEARRKAVAETLAAGRPSGSVGFLREILSAIEALPREGDGRRRLRLADLGERALDLSYWPPIRRISLGKRNTIQKANRGDPRR